MTTETKASSALMKWGQDTTDLDKFLRQIMAIVRALDSQVFFTILEWLSLHQRFSNIIKWIFVGIFLNVFFRFLKKYFNQHCFICRPSDSRMLELNGFLPLFFYRRTEQQHRLWSTWTWSSWPDSWRSSWIEEEMSSFLSTVHLKCERIFYTNNSLWTTQHALNFRLILNRIKISKE